MEGPSLKRAATPRRLGRVVLTVILVVVVCLTMALALLFAFIERGTTRGQLAGLGDIEPSEGSARPQR